MNEKGETDGDRAQGFGAAIEAFDVESDVGVGCVDVFVKNVEGQRDAELVDDQRERDAVREGDRAPIRGTKREERRARARA